MLTSKLFSFAVIMYAFLFFLTGCEYADDPQENEETRFLSSSEASGLKGSYFGDTNLSNLLLEKVDATVNFEWGTGSPDSRISNNNFSVRWEGFVTPRFSETYTFYTVADDGIRLWVNDQKIIDNWTTHSSTEDTGDIALQAGKSYPIKLEFFENSGKAIAKLLWSSSSLAKQVVSEEHLSTEPKKVIYEAEDRTGEYNCKIASNHMGYTGDGFIDFGGNGTWIEWNNISVDKAGQYILEFRYAVADGTRQAAVIVNGQDMGDVSFDATGGWVNWNIDNIKVPLQKGNNTIRVMANTDSGGPNLDHMTVYSKAKPTRPPNIVFMLADDFGYGDLSTYGHPYAKTPNLDMLAQDGTKFTRFYVTGNVCNPSRTGFMTSRNPRNYANATDDHGFQDRITITEILRQAGYKVGHFGKWHIGPQTEPGTYGIHDIKEMGGPYKDPEGRDANIYKAAIEFIEKNKDVPFYVNVWGYATHAKVNPAESLAAKFSDVDVDRDIFGVHMQSKFDDVLSIGGDISTGMRNYLGDVWGLDNAVGLLLKKLDDLGLRDNTIVVFSSDQGPAPVLLPDQEPNDTSSNMLGWAGGLRGGKHTNDEGGLRVPFIIRWPGQVPVGKTNTHSLFSAYDWLPTLASIAGADFDKSMVQGEDVSDIWKGADRSRKNPLFWWWSGSTVVQGYWKLTHERGKYELFNLADDPEELHDVSAEYPDVATKLEQRINAWRDTLPKVYNGSPNMFLDDPVKKAVVIEPADITDPPHPDE